jgi:hypothetical protein
MTVMIGIMATVAAMRRNRLIARSPSLMDRERKGGKTCDPSLRQHPSPPAESTRGLVRQVTKERVIALRHLGGLHSRWPNAVVHYAAL